MPRKKPEDMSSSDLIEALVESLLRRGFGKAMGSSNVQLKSFEADIASLKSEIDDRDEHLKLGIRSASKKADRAGGFVMR